MMEIEDKRVKKRRVFNRLTWAHVLLLFFLLIVITLAFYRLNLRRKLESRLKTIRTEGYPVTLGELNQWYSIPADTENSAYYIMDAMDYYNEPEAESNLPVIGDAKLPDRTETMSREMKKGISEFLDNNQKSIEFLHKTADLENGCYPVDFSLGMGTRTPHINNMRHMAQLLQLEAVQASEDRNEEVVIRSIKSILGVAGSLNKEPITISQAIRLACDQNAVATLEYALNRIAFSDEQLVELNKAFTKAENLNGIFNSFLGERCIVLDILMHPRPFYFDQKNAVAFPGVLLAYKVAGVNERDSMILLDEVEDAICIYSLPAHKRMQAANALNAKIASITKEHVLLHHALPLFGNSIVIDLRNLARLRTAQAAIAVERHRLKNNKLPNSLDNLVPDYFESIPLDPFDGQHIRYKKLDSGYLIYSIGDDKIDDGGKERSQESKKSGSTWDITFILEKTD